MSRCYYGRRHLTTVSPASAVGASAVQRLHHHCHHHLRRQLPLTGICELRSGGPIGVGCPSVGSRRMKTRKLGGTYKMDAIRKKYPNHTEIAYREAVSKLKYLLAESYGPKLTISKPIAMSKRICKENVPQIEEYADDTQSVLSDMSKKEPTVRSKYYSSRLNHHHHYPPTTPGHTVYGGERVAVPPAELSSFIERQEEYIEHLERESQYCKEELKNLVEKVREVVAENEALQDKNKTGFFKSILDSYPTTCADNPPKSHYEDPPLSSRKTTAIGSSRPHLEGPSIVFESRISELEAQLTQARLELRKSREENAENLTRLADRKEESQLQLELERASREKRELEARLEELQRELGKLRARDADVEARCKRAEEVAQQADYEKAQAEAEARRLRDEIERKQEKLREALQENNRRVMEEKQQVERRYSQQMEQLTADVASHWEAASKSHLESEKQKREIGDLKRELAQKTAFVDDLKKEMQSKTTKLQEELNQAISEKDANQEEISNVKLAAERNERQARQEQSRLQSEINSYKMRLERADADLVHSRRENLRLAEEIAALEKEINMNKIVEETRVSGQPPKSDRSRDEKDKDKELASLIYDLENKQAKTVAGLEDNLSKQAALVSRLTAECQSLTQRLEANDQKHKKEMADLQSNIEYLSNKIRDSLNLRERNTGENAQTALGTEQASSGPIGSDHQESDSRQQFDSAMDGESIAESREEIDSDEHQKYAEQPENYGDDYSNPHYNQYNQYDPAQYQEYFNDQQYSDNQEYNPDQQYTQNEQYPHDEQYLEKDSYKEEPYSEQDYNNYSSSHEDK